MHRTSTSSMICAAALGLASCGGSSDSDPSNSTISGLGAPGTVSLLTPNTTNVGGGGGGGGAPGLTWPAGSAYLTDAANVSVYDPAMDAIQSGNSILCMVGMTAFSQMVNAGPYIAQVDESRCQTGTEPSEGTGESSATSQNYLFFTTNATRESNSAPQFNRIWVPVNGPGDMPVLIHGLMRVDSAPTATDPYGEFTMNWAGIPNGGSIEEPAMFGLLRDTPFATPGFQYFESQGDVDVPAMPDEYSSRTAVHATYDSATERGAARIEVTERYNFNGMGDTGPLTSTYRVSFNETHFKRQLDAGPVTTFSRLDFTDHVFRYNLYFADGNDLGDRVPLNSGFNVQFEGGAHGWAGYHGIWAPESVTFTSGDTVTRRGRGNQPDVDYTVDISPGRLVEFSRSTLALANLAGQVFQWWESGTQFRVDYSVSDFRRVAEYDFGTESWIPISPPSVIDVAMAGGVLNMWSQTLGGPVAYVDGADHVTYFVEQFVGHEHELLLSAMAGEVQLFGLMSCLRSGITGAEAEQGDIFLVNAPNVNAPHSYRFNAGDLTLRHDPNGDGSVLNQVGLANGEEPMSGPNTWGMRSGPLVESLSGVNQPSGIWSVDTFFVYETGHNPWNQRVGLIDSMQESVVFDRPIDFLYTHSTANDINADATFDGQSFILSYGGPGNLHGIPFDPIDLDGDMEPDRWYPRFSIKDGTLMGPTGAEFALRALEVEQTLNEDVGGAPGLDISAADGLALPNSTNFVAPDIGLRPTITAPPAVIDGVVQ